MLWFCVDKVVASGQAMLEFAQFDHRATLGLSTCPCQIPKRFPDPELQHDWPFETCGLFYYWIRGHVI